MHLWVCYIVRGITSLCLTLRVYVGCVRVRDGESWEEALARRKHEHATSKTPGALWLRICTDLTIDKLGDLCTTVVEARVAELWHVASSWSSRGFVVRGGPFSTITLGPAEVGELQRLALFPDPQSVKLDGADPFLFRLSLRHMRDACFTCGETGHKTNACAVEIQRRRTYSHNPAEYKPLYGCYWDCECEAFRKDVSVQRNKKPPIAKKLRVYVRTLDSGRFGIRFGADTWLAGEYDEKWEACEFAREECLRRAENLQHQGHETRRYTWAPRLGDGTVGVRARSA